MSDLLKLTRKATRNLRYDEPLAPDSPLFVDLNRARGSFKEDKLLWTLGIGGGELDVLNSNQYIMFGGHRGCGKSTELRRLADELHNPQYYFVIFIDALSELDVNNLRYSDILLLQAKVLIKKLEENNIKLEQVFLTRLENWFKERIESQASTKDLATAIKAGAKAQGGIPFLATLFAELTNSVRINSTHKTEIRNVVRDTFTEFSEAFNQLIAHAQDVLSSHNLGKKLLFIVDGTDRLRSEDSERFFISDVYQLKQIESNFIYCTPIDLLTEQGVLRQEFELIRLPLVKIRNKGATDYISTAMEDMRRLVIRRMDESLFDSEETMNYLILHSGGHVRDLIRLMNYCLAETGGERRINKDIADIAIRQLATEYRRLIEQDDYKLLADIDKRGDDYTPLSKQTRRLLYDLILLEYNSYWWQTHPAVRTLDGYKKEAEAEGAGHRVDTA